MANDTFQCKKCGDILQGWQITMYREAIRKGSSVSGSIRCGRCGSVYSADEIAGRPGVFRGGPREMPSWLSDVLSFPRDFFEIVKKTGTLPYFFLLIAMFTVMLLLIWWRPLSFLNVWIKIILSIVALVISNYISEICAQLMDKQKKTREKA